MTKSSLIYSVCASLFLIIGFYACEEEDTTSPFEIQRVSRLYVSFEEFGTTDERADTTVRVVERADSSVFIFEGSHISQVEGGGAISYNPFIKTLFQASANASGIDTLVSTVSLEQTGRLNNKGSGLRSRYYGNIKGMVYHAAMKALMLVSGAGPNAGIYLVDNAGSGGGVKPPYKKLMNPDLNMWGATYKRDKIYTAKLSAPAGLYVFENLTTRSVNASDSVGRLEPTRTFQIEGASENLRGLFYDTVKNVLAITEMGNGTEGSGKILLFDNFSNRVDGADNVIRPSRVITGPNTGLKSPVDVVLDTRMDGAYLYVADRDAKKVSRFKYTDDGNVAPADVIETAGLLYGVTPVGLSLDARDDTNVPSVPPN